MLKIHTKTITPLPHAPCWDFCSLAPWGMHENPPFYLSSLEAQNMGQPHLGQGSNLSIFYFFWKISKIWGAPLPHETPYVPHATHLPHMGHNSKNIKKCSWGKTSVWGKHGARGTTWGKGVRLTCPILAYNIGQVSRQAKIFFTWGIFLPQVPTCPMHPRGQGNMKNDSLAPWGLPHGAKESKNDKNRDVF